MRNSILAALLGAILVICTSFGISQTSLIFKFQDFIDYGVYFRSGIFGQLLDLNFTLAFMDSFHSERPPELKPRPYYWTPYRLDDPLFKARYHWYRGEFENSIQILEAEINRVGRSEDALYWLAQSYARFGEAKNCLLHLTDTESHLEHLHPEEHSALKESNTMCSLPLLMVHTRKEYSHKAVEIFDELAKLENVRKKRYLWLAQFYRLTLGDNSKLNPEQKIQSPFTDFFSEESQKKLKERYPYLKLVNRAKDFGIDTLNAGRGVAVEDFDNDGDLDIITAGAYSPLQYFKNDRGHGFKEVPSPEFAKVQGGFVISMADVNNDGSMDFMVSRWNLPCVLFLNDGFGNFRDATSQWGLPVNWAHRLAFAPSFADYDNDGDLDLFIAHFTTQIPFLGQVEPSKLYRNDGDHFTDVTESMGLAKILAHTNVYRGAWGDFSGDGFPDLYLASINSASSILLKNMGGRKFEVVPLSHPKSSFAAGFLDFNHDGELDLFSPGTLVSVDMVIADTIFGESSSARHGLGESWIYINEHGKWTEHNPFPLHGRQAVMGVSYGDINGDGCQDFYFGTGSIEESYILPNLFYVSRTSGTTCTDLENISSLEGLGTVQKGHGIVFFDSDDDGDQDIFSSLGGFWPGDKWPNQFFENKSRFKYSWVKIRLKGVRANRFGVGSMIRVTAKNKQGQKIIRTYHMDTKTDFGSAPLIAHIGLMNAQFISSVEVRWPGNTNWQIYSAQLNRLNVLQEQL